MTTPETVDLSATIAPRSDQQNFDDYTAGPKTVTVTEVRKGSTEQPIEIHLAEFPGRPYKPSKSMRRVLFHAWGADGSSYAGRRLRLYGDPDVKFGNQTVGGIKISHLSHLDKPLVINLTEKKGQRKPHRVEPLPDEKPKTPTAAGIVKAFEPLRVTVADLELKVGVDQDAWTAEHLGTLAELGRAIKAGTTTVDAEFGQQDGGEQ